MTQKTAIVGKPVDFDLISEFRQAKAVSIAVAFATLGGWKSIRSFLVESFASVDIVVGLNGCITDPSLLEEWLKLGCESQGSFRVFVAAREPMFHPKVMLVSGSQSADFAIVGSGNLTIGGQADNIECGVYVKQQEILKELGSWFEGLDRVPLTPEILVSYKREHRATKHLRGHLKGKEFDLDSLIKKRLSLQVFSNQSWDNSRFIEDFGRFIESPEGEKHINNRISGAKRIQAALNMPDFRFDRFGWDEFYRIREFGSIRLAYPQISKELPKVRKLFRLVVSQALNIDSLDQAIGPEGRYHVRGVGTNLITKVMTVNNRHEWPLFNRRIIAALAMYGYKADRAAQNYLIFAANMKNLLSNHGLLDFWALDAFCERITWNL